MLKTARNMILMIFSGILLGYILMAAVYALPLDWSGERYDATIRHMKASGMYPKDRFSKRRLDNYADSVSMLLASYQGSESIWRQAAANYYISYSGDDFYKIKTTPYDWLIGNYNQETAEPVRVDYGRYWHGNILFIRPLMIFFSYTQIRQISSAVLMFLMILSLVVLRSRLPRMTLPFALMYLFLAPSAVGKCFEFPGDICIMLGTMLALLYWNDNKLSDHSVRYLFLTAGILTPYLGFFSAPTLTLTVPLILMFQMREGESA